MTGLLDPTEPPVIATLVLAAGGSARFGSPKLLAEWHGRPLVEHALELAPMTGPKVAVAGAATVRLRPLFAFHGFATVVNRRPSRGLASSLRTGLETLPEEVAAALVLLGDAPVVPEAAVERVLEGFRRENRPVAAYYDGQRGHPTILPRDVWDAIPRTGDRAGSDVDAVAVECGDLAEGRRTSTRRTTCSPWPPGRRGRRSSGGCGTWSRSRRDSPCRSASSSAPSTARACATAPSASGRTRC
jgi:CTP:molybdopterin cytidylyltransferase MocA